MSVSPIARSLGRQWPPMEWDAGLSRLSRRLCQIKVARQYWVGADPAQCGLSYSPSDAEGRTLPRLWNVHALCNGRSAFGIARLLGKAAVRPNPGACFHQYKKVCTYPPWFQSPRSDPHRVMPCIACLRGSASNPSFHAASASGCDLREVVTSGFACRRALSTVLSGWSDYESGALLRCRSHPDALS